MFSYVNFILLATCSNSIRIPKDKTYFSISLDLFTIKKLIENIFINNKQEVLNQLI
jgi:hypothetical protein